MSLQVWQYFKDYAERFNLTKHIRYNTEIKMVKRAPDFDETGRWSLRGKCVCVAFVTDKYMPKLSTSCLNFIKPATTFVYYPLQLIKV